MGGKDKRLRRNEKKFAVLEAQFNKGSAPSKSPAHGPARSPAAGPMKLGRIPAPIECLPPAVLRLVAAFCAGEAKADTKLTTHFSVLSRPMYCAVESLRYLQQAPLADAIRDAIARTAARRVSSKPLAITTAGGAAASTAAELLASVESSGDVDLVFCVAVAVLKHSRSILHTVRKPDVDVEGTEWLIRVVRGGALPLHQAQSVSGRTLLHLTIGLGDRLLALKLIGGAAHNDAFDPWVQDSLKRTVLHIAAAEGLSDVALAILRTVDPARIEAFGAVTDLAKRTAVEEATHKRQTKLATALGAALHAAQQYDDDDEEDGDAGYYDDDGYDQ